MLAFLTPGSLPQQQPLRPSPLRDRPPQERNGLRRRRQPNHRRHPQVLRLPEEHRAAQPRQQPPLRRNPGVRLPTPQPTKPHPLRQLLHVDRLFMPETVETEEAALGKELHPSSSPPQVAPRVLAICFQAQARSGTLLPTLQALALGSSSFVY